MKNSEAGTQSSCSHRAALRLNDIEMWHEPAGGSPRPWNDWTEDLELRYRVIAMDQRNAGQSRGTIAPDHGWHTYAADHLALMEHLRVRALPYARRVYRLELLPQALRDRP